MKTLRLNRRTFIARSAQATAAFSLGGSSWLAARQFPHSFTIKAAQVRGLKISPENLVVVAADDGVLFFDRTGQLQREVKAPRPVRALSFDAAGRLFVAFKNQIARLDPVAGWKLLGEPVGGRESAFTSLAISDRGELFAADSGEKTIWRLDAAGKLLGQIKSGESGFKVPRAFFPMVWHKDHLLVVDPGRHRVQSYSRDGALLASWGGRSRNPEGFSGCCNPVSVAMQADGKLVTAERGMPRVKMFAAGGELERLLAGPEQFSSSAQATVSEAEEIQSCESGLLDVALTPQNQVVVLDRTAREIRFLS